MKTSLFKLKDMVHRQEVLISRSVEYYKFRAIILIPLNCGLGLVEVVRQDDLLNFTRQRVIISRFCSPIFLLKHDNDILGFCTNQRTHLFCFIKVILLESFKYALCSWIRNYTSLRLLVILVILLIIYLLNTIYIYIYDCLWHRPSAVCTSTINFYNISYWEMIISVQDTGDGVAVRITDISMWAETYMTNGDPPLQPDFPTKHRNYICLHGSNH